MSTLSITNLDPIIQITIKYLTNNDLSLQNIANNLGISKQAVHAKLLKGFEYLNSYDEPEKAPLDSKELLNLKKKNLELQNINIKLKKELIIRAVNLKTANWLIDRIKEFIPKVSLTRFTAHQKKYILEMCDKFIKTGGTIKEFCKAINKSPETIHRWKKAYKARGIGGLTDKKTMPKNFGNKITVFLKQQLISLFLRFPFWSDYQYHKYIRFNPTTNYYVSLPTIKKLKKAHETKTEAEKARIKKRWSFAPGTDVWVIDFTCIFKTDNYKLQLLTVTDHRSRYFFESALFLETSTEHVTDHLEELFIKHGKPNIVKADNGAEFKIKCKEKLKELSVYLLNSPTYYAKFNGSHERLHRTLKKYISDFDNHRNITRLVQEINLFLDEYNYKLPHEYLEGKTPSEVYLKEKEFVPENINIVEPYVKEGELRMKFTNRNGNKARISLPLIQ